MDDDQNAQRIETIQANLDTAIGFGKLVLQSDDEREALRYKQKAFDAYEEALHLLKSVRLTDIEWESIKTKMEHLEFLLAV